MQPVAAAAKLAPSEAGAAKDGSKDCLIRSYLDKAGDPRICMDKR